MLQLNFIRENRDLLLTGLTKRNFGDHGPALLDKIIQLDDERKSTQHQLDELLSQVKTISGEIGALFKSGKAQEANARKEEVTAIKEKAQVLQDQMKQIQEDLEEQLLSLPNKVHESVPAGTSEEDNEVFQAWTDELPALGEDALPHWELAKQYKIFDLELGTKIAGSGFPVFRGKGARLQRALINFFLDEASKAGYEEIVPPLLVNEDSARATGQLPDKEGQMYYVEKDDLYLIPTAEVPVTNIYRNVILNETDFPIKLCGYTPCFRREAGSYGAHVRGLNRVHQFDKIEIVQVTHPDNSYKVLDEMMKHVASLLTKLGLPFRILRLCGGDLGFVSALTYDFEVYSAAQKRWLEVSSVSNFENYQANRLKLRYRGEDKKTHLAHTLNGSALALARIIASIMENYQTPNGIKVPEVLVSYMGFDTID